jgi:hypothetical protein
LIAIADPAIILLPWCLLCIAKQIRPGDMVMMAQFGAAPVKSLVAFAP